MRCLTYLAIFSISLQSCVSATNLLVGELPALKTGDAVIYLYHPETRTPNIGLVAATFYINGEKIVRLDENMFTRLTLKPGHYNFTTSKDREFSCRERFIPDPLPPVSINAKSDSVYYLRYASKNYIGPKHPVRLGCSKVLAQVSNDDFIKQIGYSKYKIPRIEIFPSKQ